MALKIELFVTDNELAVSVPPILAVPVVDKLPAVTELFVVNAPTDVSVPPKDASPIPYTFPPNEASPIPYVLPETVEFVFVVILSTTTVPKLTPVGNVTLPDDTVSPLHVNGPVVDTEAAEICPVAVYDAALMLPDATMFVTLAIFPFKDISANALIRPVIVATPPTFNVVFIDVSPNTTIFPPNDASPIPYVFPDTMESFVTVNEFVATAPLVVKLLTETAPDNDNPAPPVKVNPPVVMVPVDVMFFTNMLPPKDASRRP